MSGDGGARRWTRATYYTPPSEDFTRPGQIWHPVAESDHFPLWEALVDRVPRECSGPSPPAGADDVPGRVADPFPTPRCGHCRSRRRLGAVCRAVHARAWAISTIRSTSSDGWRVRRCVLPESSSTSDCTARCEFPETSVSIRARCGDREFGLAVPARAHRLLRPSISPPRVDRYLGYPGQAISYKVGERVWLEGRDRARRTSSVRTSISRSFTRSCSTWARWASISSAPSSTCSTRRTTADLKVAAARLDRGTSRRDAQLRAGCRRRCASIPRSTGPA